MNLHLISETHAFHHYVAQMQNVIIKMEYRHVPVEQHLLVAHQIVALNVVFMPIVAVIEHVLIINAVTHVLVLAGCSLRVTFLTIYQFALVLKVTLEIHSQVVIRNQLKVIY